MPFGLTLRALPPLHRRRACLRPRQRAFGLVRTVLLAAGALLVSPPACHGAASGAPSGAPSGKTGPQRDGARRLVLFYTAEVHGAVEPCGCTSDPLGDISRLAALMADAKRAGTAVTLVDAGGLLYPEGKLATREQPSANVRARFLAAQFERLGLLGAALGETDATSGAEQLRPPRLASNVTGAGAMIRAPRVDTVGGIKVGVLGVAAAESVTALGKGKAEDPVEAAKRDVAELRRQGAEIVVVLAPVDKNVARRVAREAGPDVVVLGKRVGAGMPRLERVGQALIVAPADELQRVGRLEIVLRPGGTVGAGLQDAGGAEASRLRKEELDRAVERLRADLKGWTASAPGTKPAATAADPAFLASKQRELAELQAERTRLDTAWVPPAAGNYVVNELVPLRRSLRRDSSVVTAMKKLDQEIAALNLKQAVPPPPPEPGRAYYVGTARCAGCHKAADKFWKQTVHAHAWKTLVDGGKQADYKCVSCHVTGYGQVGGSTLGFTKKLESVQCETCHGPGSIHVAAEGNEEPSSVKRDTPETVCLGCHTEQHSDTFKFEAYLRDIVGPGHGGKRREALGPGETGHQLRSAALAKAKAAGAAQVKKM
jgi:hypothetical protein